MQLNASVSGCLWLGLELLLYRHIKSSGFNFLFHIKSFKYIRTGIFSSYHRKPYRCLILGLLLIRYSIKYCGFIPLIDLSFGSVVSSIRLVGKAYFFGLLGGGCIKIKVAKCYNSINLAYRDVYRILTTNNSNIAHMISIWPSIVLKCWVLWPMHRHNLNDLSYGCVTSYWSDQHHLYGEVITAQPCVLLFVLNPSYIFWNSIMLRTQVPHKWNI